MRISTRFTPSLHALFDAGLSTLHSILGDLLPAVERELDAAAKPQEGCPERLGEAIRYSLLAPGKRLRPCLVLAAAEACSGSFDAALPAAVAVEMIHSYSLIHDDLPAMDDDDLRRGRPTCHRQFDEATAILAGDALLTRAFEVLATQLPPTKVARAVGILANAAGPSALVGGQADDLAEHDLTDAEKQGSGSPQRIYQLESIHRRKTGALFTASLQLGALSVDASEAQHQALIDYARGFGLAFQIVDDLLDFLGSADDVGKRTGKDIERGKLTFPGLLGVDASRARATELTAGACQALTLFGEQGRRLTELANFVLQRSH